MADILSQSQIDELLNSFSEVGTKAFEEIEADEKGKKAKSYDFKTPKKFTKEKLKVIDGILSLFQAFVIVSYGAYEIMLPR